MWYSGYDLWLGIAFLSENYEIFCFSSIMSLINSKVFHKIKFFYQKKFDIFNWIFRNCRFAVTSACEHSVSLELSSSRFASSNASTNDTFKSTFSGTICDDSGFLKDHHWWYQSNQGIMIDMPVMPHFLIEVNNIDTILRRKFLANDFSLFF